MNDPWRVELLGQLRLHRGERVVSRFRSPKVGLLLAYLARYGQKTHMREDLVEMLWPDTSPNAARNRLSQVVVWLRQILEPEDEATSIAPGGVLVSDRNGLRLAADAIVVDVNAFETALVIGRNKDRPANERIAALARAHEIYRGDLLPGFYDDWVIGERRRLAAARVGGLELLSALYRERADGADLTDAESYARAAVAADPSRDEAHRELMRVLAAAGQEAAALRQFHELEQILARDLGEKPSAETIAVAESIRRQNVVRVTPIPTPGPEILDHPPPREVLIARREWPALPLPLTRFFGRDAEIEKAIQILNDGTRLITLLGSGGCGKTRLAIEIGRRALAADRGAVIFVGLADLAEPAFIANEIAVCLGVNRAGADPMEQVISALSGSSGALLILDNLEHLAHGASHTIRRLLQSLPDLTILATSRQRLGIEGEGTVAVAPLPLPEPARMSLEQLAATPSVRLFVDRAQGVRPSFQLTPANAPAVADLCAHLEGIPLAIELCAAWSEILTPAQMRQQVVDRFSLLVSRREDLPDRHRTLRAAIEYSFTLLPADLRRAFVCLSIFRGGWSLEAATAVLAGALFTATGTMTDADTLELLARLRERSLIVSEESAAEDSMRFRMLETLREFGASDRGPAADGARVAEAHAEYFRAFSEIARPHLIGSDAPRWLSRMEAEHDNIRTALPWYLEQSKIREGLLFSSTLLGFWDVRGYLHEGLEWLEQFIERSEADRNSLTKERARALFAKARLVSSLGDFENAQIAVVASRAEALAAGDARQAMFALYFLGTIHGRMGRVDDARRAHEESLAEARELGDVSAIGNNLSDLGNLFMRESKFVEARAVLEESLDVFHRGGLVTNEAVSLNNLGLIDRYEGDYGSARTRYQRALEMYEMSSFKLGRSITLINLATICRLEATADSPAGYAQSSALLAEALVTSWEIGSQYVTAWALKERGNLAVAQEAFGRGIRLLGAADALREKLAISFSPSDPGQLDHDEKAARAAMGDAAFDAAWRTGRAMPLEQAVADVLAG